MALVPYTITAIERDFIDAETSGSQIVIGAVCSMYTQPSDAVVTLFDDANGSNGSTAKTTNSNGQVTVYIETGEYRLETNGISRFVQVGKSEKGTTEALIASTRVYQIGDIVETIGFTTRGDGGEAQWLLTAITGTSSQSPAQLANALLNDANGNQWAYVAKHTLFPEQLGATLDAGDNRLTLIASFASAMALGVSVTLSGSYPISSLITVTTTAGLTITGISADKSKITSPNGGLLIIQSNIFHKISISSISFIATASSSGTGLQIDGTPTLSGGVLTGRTETKAIIEDVKFTAPVAASAFQWDIGLHFRSFDKVSVNNIVTRGNQTEPLTSIGILINGVGNMVESYISNWWGYYHLNALEVADENEGLFVSDFNLVSVTNGLMMGVNTSNTEGLVANLKCLGNTISQGHTNCFDNSMSFTAAKSNQNFITDVLCYVTEGVSSPTQAIRNVVSMGLGQSNKISNLSLVTLSEITKSSLSPITIADNTHSSFVGMSYIDGVNTSLTTSNVVNLGLVKSSILEISVNTINNGFNSIFKMPNTTAKNTILAKSESSFLNGFYSPTSGTVPLGNDYGLDSLTVANTTLTGGASSQDITISLQVGKYSQAPSLAKASITNLIANGSRVNIIYDKNGSTSSGVVFRIYPIDIGGTLPSGVITVFSQVLQP